MDESLKKIVTLYKSNTLASANLTLLVLGIVAFLVIYIFTWGKPRGFSLTQRLYGNNTYEMLLVEELAYILAVLKEFSTIPDMQITGLTEENLSEIRSIRKALDMDLKVAMKDLPPINDLTA